MDTISAERPPKRQKLIDEGKTPVYGIQYKRDSQEPPSPVVNKSAGSSFTFEPLPRSNSQTNDFILDITNYIPVGCLRLHKKDFRVSSDIWNSQDFWSALTVPRDIYNTRDHPFLLNALQDLLFKSPVMGPYEVLLNSGLIRMEFRNKDQDSGQVRVYILRDDVGRADIDRSQRAIRKAMKLLLRQIDISKLTWHGQWSDDTPVAHIDSSLDQTIISKDEESLFNLFNTLPSPTPDPEIINDPYASEAMRRILVNDIQGLKTQMYSYQRRSAAMMLQREARPGQILDPRLRQLLDQKGEVWYCDPDSGSSSREPRTYEAARGGICAENMGLGKTLICLSLILATRDLSSQVPVEYSVDLLPVRKTTGSLLDMAAATIGRTATPWKNEFALAEAEGFEYSQALEAIRRETGHYFLPTPEPLRESRHSIPDPPRKIWLSTATMVVVPANLIQQWCGEIQKHTTGLKVLVMKDSKKALPPVEELIDYDIILFSKLRFDKEAKDGLDINGQQAKSRVCLCPVVEDHSTVRDCHCPKVYKSPLRDIHFKRLIFDEGHTLGNSSSSAQTDAFTVVNSLQLSARWVISGTPTQGLYGAEGAESGNSSGSATPSRDEDDYESTSSYESSTPLSAERITEANSHEKLFYQQERSDLVKLGNIATYFLKARPWASSPDGDVAQWSHHVMQPRHGTKSHGSIACLKATLEGMIIRHRPSDVILDVALPPLHQSTVYLEGSMQNKLTLNTFNMMVITNAVTSERKDADYFFHPKQRKNLQTLVSNLRQGSFFWSGFNVDHVRSTVETAKKFLDKGEIPVTPEDSSLLKQVIEFGEIIVSNVIYQQISKWHEMPMFIQNECPEEVRYALSLDDNSRNPTLMGATMVHDAQKFVESQLWKQDPMDGLVAAAEKSLENARLVLNPPAISAVSRVTSRLNTSRRASELAPSLAGGVTVGDDSTPRKRARTASAAPVTPTKGSRGGRKSPAKPRSKFFPTPSDPPQQSSVEVESWKQLGAALVVDGKQPKSALKKPEKTDVAGTLDPSSPLNSASIISTASAKLSYLLDRIVLHQAKEKILVFYETNNIAYYIAQALECLNIKHLIYAKDLKSETRSRYVVTFNSTETFRVLLMDVSQAAFGLDISSASRVYFVNPVFSPQVEAQAVKRAHRIGQLKPVYVETLVLKGSIEEVIVNRRKDLTNEEHNKCKSILDDQTMYDWIRNIKFLQMATGDIPGPEQMAKLETPQKIFGIGAGSRMIDDLNLDISLLEEESAGNSTASNDEESLRAHDEAIAALTGVAGTISQSRTPVGVSWGVHSAPPAPSRSVRFFDREPSLEMQAYEESRARLIAGPSVPIAKPEEDDAIEYTTPRKKRKTVGFSFGNLVDPSKDNGEGSSSESSKLFDPVQSGAGPNGKTET